uniref:uncharacterized protein LOC122585428 isoform X2 n=1 Tax=Erigeron canadensis TaxID=72917 RepID=UPI001CB89C65|nr:uncharacterized protein LOC122585428 isoform X2 [Erigeron canadensis]
MKKTCKNCWQKGHNVRSCKNETKDPPPQKVRGPRGRPRKAEALITTVTSSTSPRARRGGWIADETKNENMGILPADVLEEVHTGQESPEVKEIHFGDQMVDQESSAEGNQIEVGHEIDGERFEQGDDHMNGDGLDVVSQQSSREEAPDGDDLYEPSQLCGESKKRKKSERILKRKLSKPVYDEDGGGSAIDKPLILD